MMPRKQHFRHPPAVPDFRAGILRISEKPVHMAFVFIAGRVSEYPVAEAGHRIGDDQRPQLPAGQDIVPD